MTENKIWDKEETLSRDEISKLQLERLQTTLKRTLNVPFYKKKYKEMGIEIADIKTLDDVRKLPFTTKADMRDNYPLNLMAVPMSEISRIHGSSGTTGKPTFVAYTKKDKETWANICARFLTAGGLRKEDLVQIAFGFGLFTGGFGLHFGVERVGAGIVPASAGNTRRQLTLLQDLGVDALVCTPSYALTLADAFLEAGIDPRKDLKLKYVHLGGEPWTNEMKYHIEEKLGVKAFNNYGLSEVIGPGVAGDCYANNGMHFQEDHFIVECLKPDTNEPVAPGEKGELVITSLTKEACPIIRYRTRDISSLHYEKCECGRTMVRMSRVTGRCDDMMILRGVNVFPSQVEEALFSVPEISPHYMIELTRPGNTDIATVKVELKAKAYSDHVPTLQGILRKLNNEIKTITGIKMNVEIVDPNTIERFEGKAKRVIDKRDSLKVD